MKNYEVIIVGAGPAGLTAALYCARSGLKTAVVSKDIGGTTNSILELENWPGYSGPGSKLMMQFYSQVKKYEVDFIMDEVKKISKEKKEFLIETKKDNYLSKTIILSTGTSRRKLNILGEEKFLGKGVSYCVTCDAFFFKGKIAAVIGGSDCAAVSALALSDLAKKVYVIYRGEKLRCEDINSKRLENKENVEIIYNAIPKKVEGSQKVEKLIYEQNKVQKEIALEGIFVEIGAIPLTEMAEKLNLDLDSEKYIIVDENMKTSVEGIFACGDCTNQRLKQVVVASGQGAIAAKNAYDFLRKK